MSQAPRLGSSLHHIWCSPAFYGVKASLKLGELYLHFLVMISVPPWAHPHMCVSSIFLLQTSSAPGPGTGWAPRPQRCGISLTFPSQDRWDQGWDGRGTLSRGVHSRPWSTGTAGDGEEFKQQEDLGVQQTCTEISALSHASCVTWRELPNLSENQFSQVRPET